MEVVQKTFCLKGLSGDMGIGDGEKAIPYRVTPSSNIAYSTCPPKGS